MTPKILVIGVGNAYRGDDGAGIEVARRLEEMGYSDVMVLQQHGEGTALMDVWKGMDRVILVDAVSSGAAAGVIQRWAAHAQRVPGDCLRCSTHAFGVHEAMELARALKEMPQELIVYGIEGANFGAGQGLSHAVRKAVADVVECAQIEIDRMRASCTSMR